MADDDSSLLIGIRRGDAAAWEQLISRYQGRLWAFAQTRLRDEAAAEDVVQETFLGFLTALPHYDEETPLEAFLFAITAHKLTDALRKTGKRPLLSLSSPSDSRPGIEPTARDRKASSMARSRDQQSGQQQVLVECLKRLIQSWYSRGEFERLESIELLFVLGWSSKDVAARLGISEQAVANHKSFAVGKLKEAAQQRGFDWHSMNSPSS
jgi:RNA polymerase sigma-70 factor (ECF subfamily)